MTKQKTKRRQPVKPRLAHRPSLLIVTLVLVLTLALGTLSASSFFVGVSGGALSASSANVKGIDLGKFGTWGGKINKNGIAIEGFLGDDDTGIQPGCGKSGNCLTVPAAGEFRGVSNETSLRQAILKWVNFALGFLMLIAMIAILYSGFLYITARGEDEQAGKAKKGIIFTTIGIIVVLLAYSYVNTLITKGPQGSDLVGLQSTAMQNLEFKM